MYCYCPGIVFHSMSRDIVDAKGAMDAFDI